MDLFKQVVLAAFSFYLLLIIFIGWNDALNFSYGKDRPSHPVVNFLTFVMAVLIAICI